MTIIYEGF